VKSCNNAGTKGNREVVLIACALPLYSPIRPDGRSLPLTKDLEVFIQVGTLAVGCDADRSLHYRQRTMNWLIGACLPLWLGPKTHLHQLVPALIPLSAAGG
jgi:hypothetical protein